ncbi:MAG: hypothetical protein HGB02_08490 [Chlorobiaceae bacterium]|nr:hypothetical protein [Chlorobiaceae bacterium]
MNQNEYREGVVARHLRTGITCEIERIVIEHEGTMDEHRVLTLRTKGGVQIQNVTEDQVAPVISEGQASFF